MKLANVGQLRKADLQLRCKAHSACIRLKNLPILPCARTARTLPKLVKVCRPCIWKPGAFGEERSHAKSGCVLGYRLVSGAGRHGQPRHRLVALSPSALFTRSGFIRGAGGYPLSAGVSDRAPRSATYRLPLRTRNP